MKLEYDEMLSNLAFNFKLRHYSKGAFKFNVRRAFDNDDDDDDKVERCRLTVSNPRFLS